jgi:hypothetical protein
VAYNATEEEEERFISFVKELEKISVKYGITIDCVGGVTFYESLSKVRYSKDPSSGDLDVMRADE